MAVMRRFAIGLFVMTTENTETASRPRKGDSGFSTQRLVYLAARLGEGLVGAAVISRRISKFRLYG